MWLCIGLKILDVAEVSSDNHPGWSFQLSTTLSGSHGRSGFPQTHFLTSNKMVRIAPPGQ